RLRFRLRCNPVRSVKDERRGEVTRNGTTYTRSVRVPLIREEQQQQWLEKKLRQAGAQLLAVNVVQEAPLYFRKKREKRGGKIQPVLFEGVLQIEAPQQFSNALISGFGPAKSFGMGLLSLAVC
uniref:type I-E CRISPR-associated protein Cas6/Cse3/CasE n=1 Tax=Endozoicomonas sp. ONNA2 TaxID=2828741 RepID=UPI00214741E7